MFAWALYDWAHSAFGTIILTFVFAAYFTREVAPDNATGTALWGNAIGIAALLVALLAPILGAVADQLGRLKPWIAGFTLLCALATAALWWITPQQDMALPALLLVGVGILGAQLALVFYNTMLGYLTSTGQRGKWSGWGWGLGYIGGLACLVCLWFLFVGSQPLVPLSPEDGLPVRAACLFTAGWLLCFSLPLLLLTPDAPATGKPFAAALKGGLRQLYDSLSHIRRYPHLLRFMLAHMLYIDALAAVFAMGGVYAAGTIGMDTQQILLFGITLNVSAGLGAIGFAWVDDRLGSRQTILIGLGGLIVSACAMLLAQSVAVFWACGLVLGIFVGPVQSASRAYLAQTAPTALRTQMFGLFALSGKATAFAGPMLVGWVSLLSGSQRIGMSTLLVLFAAGFILLLFVPKARDAVPS